MNLESLKQEKEQHMKLIHECDRGELAKKAPSYLGMLLQDEERTKKELEVIDRAIELESRNRELAEKETSKKPKYEPNNHLYICPNCREFLKTYNEKQKYSMCCGQKLDWS